MPAVVGPLQKVDRLVGNALRAKARLLNDD
jgi:hypothetical protein